jgi:hydrogenase nickel incorporation protein HypA/HybF
MHEAAIVQELITLARQKAPPGSLVLEVHASVGRLTGVSPDAMQFYFEVLREEALGPQAVLHVRLEPLRARCSTCEQSHELLEAAFLCPACGQPTLVFENGDELDLRSLVVDDGEPDHDRAEDPQEERRPRDREPPGD